MFFSANVDRFSKLFHHVICEEILNVLITKISTSPSCGMLLHYRVKIENPKMLPNFHVERDN